MSYYAIMAVGMTLVIITGGIDISVGSTMALCALGTAAALQNFPVDAPAWEILPLAALVSLGIGLLCGTINGALIVGLNLHPFIVTLGTMSIYRGLANVLPPQKTLPVAGRPLPSAFTTHFMRAELGHTGLQPMPLLIMLASVVVGWLYLQGLVAGRETYAIGGNEEAARFSGLRVGWIKLRTYSLMGLCAGLAGLVSVGRFGTASTSTASGYELTVIAAAVVGGASLLGGRGTALGALLGTLVIALIENGILILRLAQEYRLIIIGSGDHRGGEPGPPERLPARAPSGCAALNFPPYTRPMKKHLSSLPLFSALLAAAVLWSRRLRQADRCRRQRHA